jgi:hypothetical protein
MMHFIFFCEVFDIVGPRVRNNLMRIFSIVQICLLAYTEPCISNVIPAARVDLAEGTSYVLSQLYLICFTKQLMLT